MADLPAPPQRGSRTGAPRRRASGSGVEIREHKLFAPPARPGAIVRHALLERVLALGAPRVVIVQASLGGGKSTFLQQAMDTCRARRWATGWLTLDEDDDDPHRFEVHFAALVARLAEQAGAAVAGVAARVAADKMLDWTLGQLARIATPAALCLDDVQCLHNPVILRFLRDLLRALPPRCRVFIGSRSLPDIGLSSLLVAEQAMVLRTEDLRFSAAESAAFLGAEGGRAQADADADGIDAETAAAIHRRTEGWPAGLQLFRLSMARPGMARALDELHALREREPLALAGYLSENVLSMQPPEMQDFLQKTALLRRLSGPLCDEVAGGADGTARLRQLEQSGLFLEALQGSPGWYRYHSLFASFLAERLTREDPDQASAVHRRAAHWHARHGTPEEAMFHAVEAREFALAMEILDGWAPRLITSAELVTVVDWFDRLPPHEIVQREGLAIKIAWALVFLRRAAGPHPLLAHLARSGAEDGRDGKAGDSGDSGDSGDGGAGAGAAGHSPVVVLAMAAMFGGDLRGAARLADVPAVQEPAPDRFVAFERGAAANLLAFRAMAQWQEEDIRRLLVLADSHNERAQAAFSQGYTLALRCLLQVIRARPLEATGAPPYPPGLRPRLERGMAAAALGAVRIWASYEADQLDAAEALAAQFEQDITRAAVPEFVALSMVAIARLHQLRGRPARASDTLDTLERIGFESRWSVVREMVAWERLRMAAAAGDAALVDKLLRQVPGQEAPPDGSWLSVTELLSGPVLGRIRLALYQRHLSQAAGLLEAAQAMAPARPLLSLKLSVLQAQLLHYQGQPRQAGRLLLQARETARAGGCLRALLDEGAEVASLLAPPPEPAAVAAALPAAFPAAGLAAGLADPLPAGGAGNGELSQREREILRLLCSGASNREMSQQLYLSENTVKFHLKNLYLKLGVKNRAQAILRVRPPGPSGPSGPSGR
ncbi:LuxR C-terminal-related transcriptional regulator [Cupriavidus sp. USMAHM13]|uniref:LuxR C-terminal-related transcriptional regulator n=1 Tax=Cupriavidus sp. USMAHM13 TaxID=1389192 RepID=UPI000A84213F|nr:LuxR C-terminal-related transcriptional regulator [Cupriavidus sp. USMAHM13]